MTTVEDALTKAQAAVADLPDEYRSSAFTVILEFYLSNRAQVEENSQVTASRVDQVNTPSQNSVQIQLPAPAIIKQRGTRKQQIAWAAVTIEQREPEGVTTDAIRAKIRSDLGLSPPAQNNIGNVMQELVPKYFSRNRDGRRYIYRATEAISELFEDLE